MKKIFFVAILLVLLGFIGCESVVEIDPPTNLTVVGAGNGLDLKFEWDPSPTSDIDGYKIYLKEEDSIMWEGTSTEATLSNPPIGTYYVTAYKGKKSESDPSNEINTAPVSGTSDYIYFSGDPSPDHPSAFYWKDNGEPTLVSLSDTTNRVLMDFYFDDDSTFTSADIHPDATPDYNITYFKYTTENYDNITEAPSDMGSLKATSKLSLDDVYFVKLSKKNFYALIKITEYSDTPTVKAKFSYKFQQIPGYRRFK